MFKSLIFLSLSTWLFAGVHPHWDYDTHGPKQWGEFSQTCEKGKLQSPINIESNATVSLEDSHILVIDENRSSSAKVLDNGHSIEVDPKDGGDIVIGGKKFHLVQFHFHSISENTLDGKHYPLELHAVHKDKDGHLAVLGVLFDVGAHNEALDQVLNNVGKAINVNMMTLLPHNTSGYYHWFGSLTTPPCTEDVEWYLFKEIPTLSEQQLKRFQKYYNHNYRPVQPLYERKVEAH